MKTSQSFIVHVVNVKKATSEKDRKTDESKISWNSFPLHEPTTHYSACWQQ